MPLDAAGLMADNAIVSGFVQVIYHFHVPLFFFASGFLFQHSSARCATLKAYGQKKVLRVLDLLIPYVLFSLVNYVIKLVLADSVNAPVSSGLWETLLLNPIAQMGFLFALATVVLVTPMMRSDRSCTAITAVSVLLKILSYFTVLRFFLWTTNIMQYQIWFALGMLWNYKRLQMSWPVTLLSAAVFAALCAAEFVMGSLPNMLDTLTTLTGVLMCTGVCQNLMKRRDQLSAAERVLSRYLMQIYLLHTLFAAGVRIVLMKLGVENLFIHLILGFIATFAGPIICAWIAERSKVLNIVFFPCKTIRTLCAKK